MLNKEEMKTTMEIIKENFKVNGDGKIRTEHPIRASVIAEMMIQYAELNKDTLLAPHHLGREEEPREPIKEDYWEDLEEVLVGIPKMETLYAEDMVKYEQALSAHKAKYDKPVMECKRFEDKDYTRGKEVYVLWRNDIVTEEFAKLSVHQQSNALSWCDKKEHDDKVSKWELRQRLYEGFEKDTSGKGFEIYVLSGVVQVVFIKGGYLEIRTKDKRLSGKGITLHQFEAITGLKSIEL